MSSGRRVVITGISSHWGGELARSLDRDPRVEHLVGIDWRPPRVELERTELIEADLRNPALSRLLPSTEADTIVHCGILLYPEPGRPPRALHDINVIGTLQLLAACERTESLRHVIVRGSAAIYGCEGGSAQFFTEDVARGAPLRTRFQRDIFELEEYFANFARRHPDLTCTMFRIQPEIAAGLDAPLVHYLNLPIVPVQLGFDPRLQLLHADDATGALVAAVAKPVSGPINVAPDGAVSLSRMLRILRRPTVPVPHRLFEPMLRRLGSRLGAGALYGDGVQMLRFGRGVDNRRLRAELGYEPRFDSIEAVRDLAAKTESRRIVPSLHPGALAGRLIGAER
ncbi:MAG: NAD-dependent epimerase/dehydratase family protein [Solirubrobacterales bacterium]